jgi:hypothetical protein
MLRMCLPRIWFNLADEALEEHIYDGCAMRKFMKPDFLAEDVLEVYSWAYNPAKPVVFMDEKPFQLLAEVRQPIRMKPPLWRKLTVSTSARVLAAFSFSRSRLPAGDTQKRLSTEPRRIGRIG